MRQIIPPLGDQAFEINVSVSKHVINLKGTVQWHNLPSRCDSQSESQELQCEDSIIQDQLGSLTLRVRWLLSVCVCACARAWVIHNGCRVEAGKTTRFGFKLTLQCNSDPSSKRYRSINVCPNHTPMSKLPKVQDMCVQKRSWYLLSFFGHEETYRAGTSLEINDW